MSNKNLYEVLNSAKVDPPQDLTSVSNKEIEKYKRTFLSSRIQKKSKRKVFPALVAASFLLFSLVFTEPGAHVLAGISNFYKEIFNPISFEAKNPQLVEPLITEYNKSITVNGIKVTLKEALLDDKDLFVNVVFNIDEKQVDNYKDMDIPIPMADFDLELDGKRFLGQDLNLTEFSGTIESVFPKKGSQQQYFKFTLNEEVPIKDINNFSLVFSDFYVIEYASALDAIKNEKGVEEIITKDLGGQGKIDFSIKDSTNNLHTKEKILNQKIGAIENLPISLEKVRINPLSMKIIVKRQLDTGEFSLLENNQRQAFTNGIYFKVIDQSGKEYIVDNFKIIKDYYTFSLNQLDDTLLNSNSITLIPQISQEVKNNIGPTSYEFFEDQININI